MTWREVTLAGYCLLATSLIALLILGRRPETRIPRLGTVLSRAMATRSGRIAVLAGWAWLGMHYFSL